MVRPPQSGLIPTELERVFAQPAVLLFFLPLLFHLVQVVRWMWGFVGALSMTDHGVHDNLNPQLTVVLPARNEATTLPNLLGDLAIGSLMPAEVIIVDDASEDGTLRVLEKLDSVAFPLRIIPNPGSGKKAGLSAGIRAATTPWIVQVDADVRVGPGFIHAVQQHIEKEGVMLDMMLLPLRLAHQHAGGVQRIMDLLQALDFSAMQGWAVAAVRRGRPAMASGGAWAWRRSAFPHDGLRPERASGDDVFSLAAIIERGNGHRVGWCGHPAAMASAAPMPDLGSLLDQRIRWGAKSASYPATLVEARRVATVIATMHIAGVALPFFSLPAAVAFWTLKACIDMTYTHQVGQAYGLFIGFNAMKRWGALLLLAVTHPPFIITTLLLMPFRRVRWKGRTAN